MIARLADRQIRAREEQAQFAVAGAEARERAARQQIAVIRLGEGERLPDFGIDDTEDRSGGRDAESEGQNGGDGERRLTTEGAGAVADITPDSLKAASAGGMPPDSRPARIDAR